jgi:hypothetical protein
MLSSCTLIRDCQKHYSYRREDTLKCGLFALSARKGVLEGVCMLQQRRTCIECGKNQEFGDAWRGGTRLNVGGYRGDNRRCLVKGLAECGICIYSRKKN